jgi:hypothetical protein
LGFTGFIAFDLRNKKNGNLPEVAVFLKTRIFSEPVKRPRTFWDVQEYVPKRMMPFSLCGYFVLNCVRMPSLGVLGWRMCLKKVFKVIKEIFVWRRFGFRLSEGAKKINAAYSFVIFG